MSWRVRVLASPATSPGYRLAGLGVEEVRTPRDAGDRLARTAAQPDVGIILIEQALLDATPEAVRREVESHAVPLLVPIPTPTWGEEKPDAEAFILELLRRAIGYRVRLQ
jgi:vacuolar-type H+-ATPase subunit F/Vma7